MLVGDKLSPHGFSTLGVCVRSAKCRLQTFETSLMLHHLPILRLVYTLRNGQCPGGYPGHIWHIPEHLRCLRPEQRPDILGAVRILKILRYVCGSMRIWNIWGGWNTPRYSQKLSWDCVDIFRPGYHISQGHWRSSQYCFHEQDMCKGNTSQDVWRLTDMNECWQKHISPYAEDIEDIARWPSGQLDAL